MYTRQASGLVFYKADPAITHNQHKRKKRNDFNNFKTKIWPVQIDKLDEMKKERSELKLELDKLKVSGGKCESKSWREKKHKKNTQKQRQHELYVRKVKNKFTC